MGSQYLQLVRNPHRDDVRIVLDRLKDTPSDFLYIPFESRTPEVCDYALGV